MARSVEVAGSLMMVTALRILVISFFLSPFFILMTRISQWDLPPVGEWLSVLGFTLMQAVGSSLFSLVFGLIGAWGLVGIPIFSRWRRGLRVLLILPNALPVMVTLMACFQWIQPFPFGWWGIVLVHTILNVGLVALFLENHFQQKVGGMAELCLVEGASRWQFFWTAVIRYLWRDFAKIGFFVFALAMTSFVVPLMVGGTRAVTLEVLIYEKIKISGQWSQALGIASLQVLVLMFLAFFLRSSVPKKEQRSFLWHHLSLPGGWLLAIAPGLLVLVGSFNGVLDGWKEFSAYGFGMEQELIEALSLTLQVGILTGVGTVATLFLIAFASPHFAFQKFLQGYLAPSTVITGFAFLILLHQGWLSEGPAIACGLILMFTPTLYRMRGESLVDELSAQIEVAQILGAGRLLTFWQVVLPQVWQPTFLLGGLASLWAVGDLGLSTVLSSRQPTLALLVQGLMESYRFDAASFLTWMVLLVGLVLFGLFWGIGRVYR